MMKDITILTFYEIEKIRQDIDNMIDNAKAGMCGETDATAVCKWLLDDLVAFRQQFD